MAVTQIGPADVAEQMTVALAELDAAYLQAVIDAAYAHAAGLYLLDDDNLNAGQQAARDLAMRLQCVHLYQRKETQNGYAGGDELGPIEVKAFDVDVSRLLMPFLRVAGIFGRSETAEEA